MRVRVALSALVLLLSAATFAAGQEASGPTGVYASWDTTTGVVQPAPPEGLPATPGNAHHAAPVDACAPCAAPSGSGAAPRRLDAARLWEWLTYRPLRSYGACGGRACAATCRPRPYLFFVDQCLEGQRPVAPSYPCAHGDCTRACCGRR